MRLPELKDTDTAIERVRNIVNGRLTTSKTVREQHGSDESWHEIMAPDAVCYPNTTEEVAKIVACCAESKTPVIPYGTGTALEGHVQAPYGGITLNMTEMNQILRVDQEALDCSVQPGVTRKQLNEHLRDTGLFFPIDPGADASIGGMTATRASGTNAVRYGTMRENVLSLNVVTADGRTIRTARRARKSSAGYDLTRLFVGSEGTLGVITEVTLRLYGIPEAISCAVVAFEDIHGAINTVIATIQSGIPVARIELLDDVQLDAINKFSGLNYPVKNTLFLEFHGTKASVEEQAKLVNDLSNDFGGGDYKWTTSTEERNHLWQARHDAAYACKALRKGCELWATDVCVPISRLAECIVETKKDLENCSFPAPLAGHVGDSNFHLGFVIDPNNPKEIEEASKINERLVMRALAMDGTCTGEHGIGLGKTKFLPAEHGEGVGVMRSLKHALDPNNIMNPGKIFPNNL